MDYALAILDINVEEEGDKNVYLFSYWLNDLVFNHFNYFKEVYLDGIDDSHYYYNKKKRKLYIDKKYDTINFTRFKQDYQFIEDYYNIEIESKKEEIMEKFGIKIFHNDEFDMLFYRFPEDMIWFFNCKYILNCFPESARIMIMNDIRTEKSYPRVEICAEDYFKVDLVRLMDLYSFYLEICNRMGESI